jgi:prolyl oligopeptidase
MLPDPSYPLSARGPSVMTAHGRTVPDPFAWLSGPEVGAVARWSAGQQVLTDAVMVEGTEEPDIRDWLTRFLDHPFTFHAFDAGQRRFMLVDRPDREQPVLVRQDLPDGPVLPVFESSEGETMVQDGLFPSPDGRHLAFALKPPKGDFAHLRVIEVETGRVIADGFPQTVLPSVAWARDGRSFFYNQNQGDFLPEAEKTPRPDGIYRRRLGETTDTLVLGMTWPEAHGAIPTVSDDGRFLFINQLKLVADLSALSALPLDGDQPGAPFPLVETGKATFAYIGERDGLAVFQTNLGARLGRVIGFDLRDPTNLRVVEIVPEQALPMVRSIREVRSERAALVEGGVVLTFLDGPAHRVRLFGPDGRMAHELPLPRACSVAGPGGDRYGSLSKASDGGLLIDLWAFERTPSSWRWTAERDVLEPIGQSGPAIPGAVVEQTFFKAADGTAIPVTILRPAGVSGPLPCLLYGYGGAGQPITPEFSLDIAAWLALGGVYVVAHIRGGGEYGEPWHHAAWRETKHVTFDDFCAAAEYLVAAGVAERGRVAIRGISFGGMLVGAALTRRPELFAGVVAEIPMLDPLSIGRDHWSAQLAPELGNPAEDPAAFDVIRAYSPLQNLKPGMAYPPTLTVMADQDAQPLLDGQRKFVATLQSEPSGGGPHLLHIVRGAGHGGWTKSQTLNATAREVGFLARALHVDTTRLSA